MAVPPAFSRALTATKIKFTNSLKELNLKKRKKRQYKLDILLSSYLFAYETETCCLISDVINKARDNFQLYMAGLKSDTVTLNDPDNAAIAT